MTHHPCIKTRAALSPSTVCLPSNPSVKTCSKPTREFFSPSQSRGTNTKIFPKSLQVIDGTTYGLLPILNTRPEPIASDVDTRLTLIRTVLKLCLCSLETLQRCCQFLHCYSGGFGFGPYGNLHQAAPPRRHLMLIGRVI